LGLDPVNPTAEVFSRALDSLVQQLKADRSVLAAILCGSLSHDTVWAKSDIDLVLVTVDDGRVASEASNIALNADGVNVHAQVFPRALFRKTVEGSLDNSFVHSYLAKGRLLYTHDPTIAALVERLGSIGDRDTEQQLLCAGTSALPFLYKARKWFVTRGDLDYTALWLLYAATPLAQVEVVTARQLVDREVILQALRLNPTFFATIYTDLLNVPKTRPRVEAALETAEQYVAERATVLFRPVLDYLREAGDARSTSEIDHHFKRTRDLDGVMLTCEYLADQGYLGKVSTGMRATKKSTVSLQELAFFYSGVGNEG
jgi:hypothetical protein